MKKEEITLRKENEQLKEKIAKLEANKEKLLHSLRIKSAKDDEFYVYLPESELLQFFHKSKCDQKLLAILYWDKLTDSQKEVFNDSEEASLAYEYERKRKEIMTNPTKLKRFFLEGAAPILDNILEAAKSKEKASIANTSYEMKEVWEVLKNIISTATDEAPMIDLRGKDISGQIDEILTQLTNKKITIVEAKELMGLVSSGFNLQQLPLLMQKLEALENGS